MESPDIPKHLWELLEKVERDIHTKDSETLIIELTELLDAIVSTGEDLLKENWELKKKITAAEEKLAAKKCSCAFDSILKNGCKCGGA